MDSNIYYNCTDQGLLITSNIDKFKKNMDLGIFPKTNYEKIPIENVHQYGVRSIAFDEIGNDYFQSIKDLFSKCQLGAIAFHESRVDLLDIVLNVEHLIVGESSKINLSAANFKNLKEITFLSVKTFKGKILDEIESVEKLTLWYEDRKSNEIVAMFPNLNEFWINNGSVVALDLTQNTLLKRLELHRCLKLEKVSLNPSTHLERVIVEACKKLDVSNLGNNVIKW